MPDVRNNTAHHRFELEADGHTAVAEYKLADGVITFTHTGVPKELGGRGIGTALARGALDWVRAQGLKVVPQCPFIKGYIAKHAEYADLLK
jgi:predicted GNAT family acetyltransferase